MTGHLTVADLDRVLAAHPTLTADGYDHPDCRQPDKFTLTRNRLARALDEVQAAHDWLLTLRRARITRDTPTSYTLKHIGEHHRTLPYVTNGAMIAAAYLAGVAVKVTPGNPNPQIGVTTEPVRQRPARGSFAAWLAERVGERSPIGDLARDAADDTTWPAAGEYRTYYDYLTSVHASQPAIDALRAAWTDYSGTDPADPDEDRW